MTPFIAIARLHACPGKRDDALRALQDAQLHTHEEPGCRLYALHNDEADPAAFVMIEGWDSDDALEAHIATAHIQHLISISDGLFDGPLQIERLTALPFGSTEKGQ